MASSGGNRSSSNSNIFISYSPLFRIYKDGRFERLQVAAPVRPSLDPQTTVESKDIKILLGENADEDTCIFVRLFKPNLCREQEKKKKKIPLMVYFHGGGFCADSTFSLKYHGYLNSLASQARTLIVSVEYRLAPEHPLPTGYDDCWHALNWAANHSRPNITCLSTNNNNNAEPWLLEHADFSRIFLAGDSSGANIVHQMALRIGLNGLASGFIHHISGIIMFHPFFWGKTRIGDEVAKSKHRRWAFDVAEKLWTYICPNSTGNDDPWIDPANEPQANLSRLACERVLIIISGEDLLRDRGLYYKEVLEKSGWQGKAELVEYKGERHIFHLLKPSSVNALDVMSKVVAFINYPAPVAAIAKFSNSSRL